MNPISSQFSDRESKSKNIPKKIKSSGGSNPYKQLNQMLDFEIKQEKLEDLKKKKKLCPPPGLNAPLGRASSG
jgi:hypothetical protein